MTYDPDVSHPHPTRDQQQWHAAHSPIKTPHDETAHVLPGAMQRAVDAYPGNPSRPPASGHDHEQAERETTMLTTTAFLRPTEPVPDASRPTGDEEGDPLERARLHRRSIDVLNSGAGDSTVDTDAKGLDAARRIPGQDHFVTSNACLDNAVATSDTGLAGFDSRRKDQVLTSPGTRAVLGEWVDVERPGVRALPTTDRPVDGWRQRPESGPHVAINHVRAAQVLRLETRRETEHRTWGEASGGR